MDFAKKIDPNYVISINDNDEIVKRYSSCKEDLKSKLKSVLFYLYPNKSKPTYSLDNKTKNVVIASNELSNAEVIMLKYLFTRGCGSEKSHYGKPALKAAREAQYKCKICSYPDVRCLILDHIWDDTISPAALLGFEFLCQNCHAVKSRSVDWTGKKLNRNKKDALKHYIEKNNHLF